MFRVSRYTLQHRVMALSKPGEVLVSRVVTDPSWRLKFSDRGSHELLICQASRACSPRTLSGGARPAGAVMERGRYRRLHVAHVDNGMRS